MSTVRWSAIRDKHVEAIGREDVERGTSRLISQVRAHRLADMRKRRGVTQREVAQAMGVTVGRAARSRTANSPASTSLTATSPPSDASRSRRHFGDEQFKVG
jgi:hypothetical protein